MNQQDAQAQEKNPRYEYCNHSVKAEVSKRLKGRDPTSEYK